MLLMLLGARSFGTISFASDHLKHILVQLPAASFQFSDVKCQFIGSIFQLMVYWCILNIILKPETLGLLRFCDRWHAHRAPEIVENKVFGTV
jgi:hypothetical protein